MSNENSKGSGVATPAAQALSPRKIVVIAGLILGAFLVSYNFASARDGGQAPQPGALATLGGGIPGGSSGGDGCCGGGGPEVEAATTVEGDVQTIAVDTSSGSFNPSVIKAKAGVPIEIAFSQAPGGCMSGVFFPDFNINEDLTAGGKTISVPALEPGEYQFFCQMQMVSAKIVVE